MRWSQIPSAVRLWAGSFILCLAWLAIAQARILGINFLLSVLVLVWAADISAYFAGRTFGGKFSSGKLAPSISPGKTWEGVWGGLIGVFAVAFIWRIFEVRLESISPSFYSYLADRGTSFLIAGVIIMVAMSVVGDLVESLIKRSAGVKDSSALLPGHGGVLDRVDALLPALPLAMMLISI
jgi:phosphatidate cytidylyltransferase